VYRTRRRLAIGESRGNDPGYRREGQAMKDADEATDPFDDITLVPNNTEELLNERQFLDYRSEREHCLDWLLTFGKEPE
jgi:hypothetical protein